MASNVDETHNITNSKEQQEARAYLRERFLRCISSLSGKACTMKTVELTNISGVFQGMDIHVQSMFIKNLSTPFTNVKNSLIRTPDVLYVNFPDIREGKTIKESTCVSEEEN